MQEISLPCSVITSHGEPSQTRAYTTSATVVLDPVAYTAQNTEGQSVQPATDEIAVFELVNMKIWPEEVHQPDILEPECRPSARKRKHKRPYSPVPPLPNKKLMSRRRNIKKIKPFTDVEGVPPGESDVKPFSALKPFSCDKCKSPYVVNPARVYVPNSRKRSHRPRKAFDPVSKKTLLLCNACGLAMTRQKKQKQGKIPPSEDAKQTYLEESTKFAANLAESLQEPDANRLYCPSFKMKPCQCLQNYIMDKGGGESQRRAIFLLNLLKDAKNLSKQKNSKISQELPTDVTTPNLTKGVSKIPTQRGISKRRSQLFEDFVLTKRLYLRNELGLCERACQKVLMYSNNFLHKNLKSSPDKSPRIEKVSGRSSRNMLKPISELVNETCCGDRCVLLASTHSKLLESWRLSAKLGQREARRVLAEMLTPSGGTKANCYRFISMITGCSHTTICLVNDQMRRTQGDREPPEHGLKQWWRLHRKEKTSQSGKDPQSDSNIDKDDPDNSCNIRIPTEAELQLLDHQEASRQLEIQRQKLVQLKEKLTQQQMDFEQKQQQRLEIIHKSQPNQDPKNNVITTPSSNSQQLLHILEIPPSTPSVITNVSESTHTQPAISVMTASGGFEPLASISVNLAGGGQTTFSNVVILPDSVLEAPVLNQETVPSGSQNFTYNSNTVECENGHTTQSHPATEFNLVPAVFPTGNKECCDMPRLYYLDP